MNCLALKLRLEFGFYRLMGVKVGGLIILNKVDLRALLTHINTYSLWALSTRVLMMIQNIHI